MLIYFLLFTFDLKVDYLMEYILFEFEICMKSVLTTIEWFALHFFQKTTFRVYAGGTDKKTIFWWV